MIETNTKFHKLTVISYVEKKKIGKKYYEMYLCLCDCGKEKIVNGHHLKRGSSKSCNCDKGNKIDHSIIGKKFGKLTVIEFSHIDKRKSANFKCICDCGNKKICNGYSLKRGRTKSCGCISSPSAYKTIKIGLWNHIKYNAQIRNIELLIDPKDIYEQFQLQNGICALSGLKITLGTTRNSWTSSTASLDRINSQKPYIKGNIQWVHKIVNKMKMELEEEEFIFFCTNIANYQKERLLYEKNTTTKRTVVI